MIVRQTDAAYGNNRWQDCSNKFSAGREHDIVTTHTVIQVTEVVVIEFNQSSDFYKSNLAHESKTLHSNVVEQEDPCGSKSIWIDNTSLELGLVHLINDFR